MHTMSEHIYVSEWRKRQVADREIDISGNPIPSGAFPQRLRIAREMRGLDQSALAEKSGLPPSSISHFEASSRKPSFENLRRLANALEVTTDYLLGRVDDPEAYADADPLYRDFKNLSSADRDLAQSFIKMLSDRKKGGGEGA